MLLLINRHPKAIACFFLVLFYMEWVLAPVPVLAAGYKTGEYYSNRRPVGKEAGNPLLNPVVFNSTTAPVKNLAVKTRRRMPMLVERTADKPLTGGPGQPEMQAFSSVNSNNMVDLFSGDFSYNIPLLDVGGYPIGLSYKGGISMDQEASWVGLGWNINPGTISRNLRGLPDDFDGKYDSVKKTMNIRENKTIGVTAGADVELVGTPLSVGASLGVFHNNYKGWGLEQGINASINSGRDSKGPLTGGLSITNNSQGGLTISPSLSVHFSSYNAEEQSGSGGSFSLALPYNSRSGLKGLEFSTGLRQYTTDEDNQTHSHGSSWSSTISFASPSFTPTMTMPLTNRQFSFTGKLGYEEKPLHPDFSLSGYVSKQRIDARDTTMILPSYGYLHFQDGTQNSSSLTDFNLEKEIPYRESPAVPNIAVPSYTYDAFSITGEGTGGMFRAYRGDIGFVHDHFIRSRDESDRASVDVGIGDMVHVGLDLNINRAFTQSGPWDDKNVMQNNIGFQSNKNAYEAVYFRNPGEKSINSKQFYDVLGGDDVVAVQLYQPGISSSNIQATGYLTRYHNRQKNGTSLLTPQNTVKTERDRRTQVISYLTAKEADVAGLSKYIENYTPNQFSIANCNALASENLQGNGTGLPALYFRANNLSGVPYARTDATINFNWGKSAPNDPPIPIVAPFTTGFPGDNFSIRWQGQLKPSVTGAYVVSTVSDDGTRLWINDSLLINDWNQHAEKRDTVHLNLVAGEFYKLRMEYMELGGKAEIKLQWIPPGSTSYAPIPTINLYPPAPDTFKINNYVVKEKRVNVFRKQNHISEIDVLNTDGKRYVYGIPVYNLKQKEATFAADGRNRGNRVTGFVGYTPGQDNTTKNQNGKDWYFNSEEVPAYAHSFLLTGIVSADYVDVTDNGISDDDLGDAVKFNYSKLCGIANPYLWRAPYTDSATFSEGMRTDYRDDKGNYVYGEKELWYLHSIESKTMVATFTLENRLDLNPINEDGNKISGNPAQRLKEINLYSKADFLKKGTAARPIKTVHFEYSYELCPGINKPLNDSGKLTLKKVWFTYNNNQKGKQNPYIFHYNSKNPAYNIKSYDRWGNYKDPLQNPGSATGNLIKNDEYPYALQDSTLAAANAAAWTLDSIYLPSGGAMKIDFESDDYAYVQNKRAAQLLHVAGLGSAPGLNHYSTQLYTGSAENLYVYVRVPSVVSNVQEVYRKYLDGLTKLYFRLSVKMPDDPYGTGYEYVPCYADLDPSNGYGMVDAHTIWVKLSGISLAGTDAGSYSPLAKAAIQFLRLNLPSKAYPGSEVGDNIDLTNGVKIIFSLATNIISAFSSFDRTARNNGWATQIDTSRTWIRLNSPDHKKYGGGQRVKRITIYDNWDKMTGQRAAMYGQEYSYTTTRQINGDSATISSGVASYEPGIGGDENPFHVPIEYVEKIAPLGPVTLGYNEEPLGESFFPSAGVGYSKVSVRTINYLNKKSANGHSETQFYTAYDFPVYTDRSLIDDDTKKRYKPSLSNFLRINAKYHMVLSQGFKVELNDMHGKLRSEATYAETDPRHPVTYTENIYKVEDPLAENKRLSNTAMSIAPDGTVDSAALIGKDAELMVAMREQLSVTNAYNISPNSDMFTLPWPTPPFFILPSLLNLAQREENIFRSAAVTKIIQRYGIVDSVIHIDKGSKVSTKAVLYDSETGDAVLTRTQNEFNDPVYNFSYPSHWAYDGMGPAYKNIDVVLNNVTIKNGRLVAGLQVSDSLLFSGGDEILVGGKQKTGSGSGSCNDLFSTFPLYTKIWAVDSSVVNKGPKTFYFIDKDGRPYSGYGISLKITRSGRRNKLDAVGSITGLDSMLRKNNLGNYTLALNTASKIVNASGTEFRQLWKVEDQRRQGYSVSYLPDTLHHCNDTLAAGFQDSTIASCFSPSRFSSYSENGPYIFSSTSDNTGVSLNTSNHFWENPGNSADGRLNRVGVWLCNGCTNGFCAPGQTWVGFSTPVYIPASDTVFIGMAGDNQVRVIIDQHDTIQVLQKTGTGDSDPFTKWYIYPKYLTQGYHNFKIQGWNVDNSSPATFGAEIYRLSRAQFFTADTTTIQNNTLFSTATIALDSAIFTRGYSCPVGYDLDSTGGHYTCIHRMQCPDIIDTIYATSCYSTVTDTSLNPYLAGILGNWRANRSYTYFGRRAESDPFTTTNIRANGVFASFNPFWNFQSGSLQPQYDTSRWVWNSEMTLFNRKGLEIENKDPLGRYNAGLYGYNLTLPTAVVQNARNRESAYEGFEDYGFVTQVCDTSCAIPRHFDFTSYQNKLDTVTRHSGKSSLRLAAGEQAALSFALSGPALDTVAVPLTFTTQTDACVNGGATSLLKQVKTNSTALLPLFTPSPGQRMLVSAWVKENQDCKCVSYTNNRIVISFSGGSSSSVIFNSSGSIIEGWQRYEGIFDIPANATSVSIALESTGAFAVNFDDLRLHPFNANMKSFVYNPSNLRLMAELDENNYASFYEYDDDGTLIRVKKETQRGIKTIKETRSALIKQ